MNLGVRIVLYFAILIPVWMWERSYMSRELPPQTANASIAQVNGGDTARDNLVEVGNKTMIVNGVTVIGTLALTLVLFATWRPKPGIYYRQFLLLVAMCLMAFSLQGCVRSFDVPEYTNETAFLIKLEGDNLGAGGQAKFQSEAYLETKKVATKRIQITHRWNETGRMNDDGSWIPDVRLIKVNRTPITRVWTKTTDTGTSAKNEAVSVESKDSVNFHVGWTCTAYVKEEDAAKFLYWYPTGTSQKTSLERDNTVSIVSLAPVMDTEVLGRIQRATQAVCAKYEMDECRTKKAEIQNSVETDITAFYKDRGITITNIGMYGGLSYDNPQIQASIDEAAKASNLKVVEQAKLDAQKKTNERINLEAQGKATAALAEADGQTKAKLVVAKGDADALAMITTAMENAGKNPLVVQYKLAQLQLEIEKDRASRWDGRYPLYYMGNGLGNGVSPNLMMQMPAFSTPTTQPSK
jgi:regulator of protease activity HflC (stomatin/prohibitin superfamily)